MLGKRKAVVVLGMHRSGTSALTGVLSMLGADPGASLMPADAAINPKGFWEHAEIVAIHERMLLAIGSSWHDERTPPDEWWMQPVVQAFRSELMSVLQRDFSDSPLWIIKDPRIDRLLPLWLDMLRAMDCQPHFVISLRHPVEVAQSLAHRDEIPEERSSLLWLQHVLDSEKWTRGLPRILVTYEELIADWQAVTRRIGTALSLDFSHDDAEVRSRVQQFLEPSLRHHAHGGAAPSGPASRLALTAYEACIVNRDRLEAILTPIANETAKLADTVAPWSAEIQVHWQARKELVQQLAVCRGETEEVAREVARVKATVSWRITSPLRAVWNFCRKLTGS